MIHQSASVQGGKAGTQQCSCCNPLATHTHLFVQRRQGSCNCLWLLIVRLPGHLQGEHPRRVLQKVVDRVERAAAADIGVAALAVLRLRLAQQRASAVVLPSHKLLQLQGGGLQESQKRAGSSKLG